MFLFDIRVLRIYWQLAATGDDTDYDRNRQAVQPIDKFYHNLIIRSPPIPFDLYLIWNLWFFHILRVAFCFRYFTAFNVIIISYRPTQMRQNCENWLMIYEALALVSSYTQSESIDWKDIVGVFAMDFLKCTLRIAHDILHELACCSFFSIRIQHWMFLSFYTYLFTFTERLTLVCKGFGC